MSAEPARPLANGDNGRTERDSRGRFVAFAGPGNPHAKAVASLRREEQAAGVYMLPVPARGILQGIDGLEAARAVPGIEEIALTVAQGQEIEPLPEGNRYLGFLFAKGARPAAVEAALRLAHQRLHFRIRPLSP
jgi:hypothetical protein